MKKELVSIITPCYNSEGYLYRLLDSVLMQDYPSIEMFAVDDGSTDNTRQIIESYIPKFSEKGYTLTYIYQDNAGQAAAVNRGLKLVTGEYLTWPDSDDYYTRVDAISTFVGKLKTLDETYGAVCFIGTFVDENTLEDLHWKREYNGNENLFESILLGGDFLAVPINYMVKMSIFDKVNPQRDIYSDRQPQNMQMFMPICYQYKCLTIKDSLCNIVVRNKSHSHFIKTYEQQLDDLQGYLDIKINTLDRMDIPNRERWKLLSHQHILSRKLELAFAFSRNKDAHSFAKMLTRSGFKLSYRTKAKLYLLGCPLFYNLFKTFRKKW